MGNNVVIIMSYSILAAFILRHVIIYGPAILALLEQSGMDASVIATWQIKYPRNGKFIKVMIVQDLKPSMRNIVDKNCDVSL